MLPEAMFWLLITGEIPTAEQVMFVINTQPKKEPAV